MIHNDTAKVQPLSPVVIGKEEHQKIRIHMKKLMHDGVKPLQYQQPTLAF